MEQLTAAAVRDIAQLAAVQVMQALGVTSGELSYRQAVKTYGAWFAAAVKGGRISPARTGGKHAYKVTDILALRAADETKAAIQTKQ